MTEIPEQWRKPTQREMLYTDEALESIRNLWDNSEASFTERFKNLREVLVPMYLDDGEFIKMFFFKEDNGLDLTNRQVTQIVPGLEKFIFVFLRTQRAIASGKFVGMKG